MTLKTYLIISLFLLSLGASGQVREAVTSYYDSVSPKPALSWHVFYDKKGNQTKQIQKQLNKHGDYIYTTDVNEYDEADRKKLMTITEKHKGFPDQTLTYTYVYSSQGYHVLSENGKRICTLDTRDNLLKEEYYNTTGALQFEIRYEYDVKNRLIREERKRATGSGHSSLVLYTYIDSLNQRTEHQEYTDSDSVKIIKDYITVLTRTNKSSRRTCTTDSTLEVYTYDQPGNEVLVQAFDSKNKLLWQRVTKYLYWK